MQQFKEKRIISNSQTELSLRTIMKTWPHLASWVWSKDYRCWSLLAPQSSQASAGPVLEPSAQSVAATPCLPASAWGRTSASPVNKPLHDSRPHISLYFSRHVLSCICGLLYKRFPMWSWKPHSMTSSALPRIPPPPDVNHTFHIQSSVNKVRMSWQSAFLVHQPMS